MLYHDPTIRMRKTNYQSPPPPKPIAPRAGSYLARRICSRAGARCDAPIQEHRHDELCVRCFRVALSALGSAVQSLSEQCSAVPMDSPPSAQYCCNAYNVQRQCGHCGQACTASTVRQCHEAAEQHATDNMRGHLGPRRAGQLSGCGTTIAHKTACPDCQQQWTVCTDSASVRTHRKGPSIPSSSALRLLCNGAAGSSLLAGTHRYSST